MIFFNDPLPVPNPEERAVRLAVEIQRQFKLLDARWRKHGYELGMGIGIAQGFATIGAMVGIAMLASGVPVLMWAKRRAAADAG